jgi:8-oxo-dGTP diphosphatase
MATTWINEQFGNSLRVRVCGVLLQESRILLVNHQGLGPEGTWWSPPGGGLEFGESVNDGLRREFLEETGLEIAPKELWGVHEHVAPPLHAVELFFLVSQTGGQLITGIDPELGPRQIIKEVKWMPLTEVAELPTEQVHPVVMNLAKHKDLSNWRGFFTSNGKH